MEKKLVYLDEEVTLLEKIKVLHDDNVTPNHREEGKSVVELAIEGADMFSSFPLKSTEEN